MSTQTVLAHSAQGGTITYSSTTPTVCTVNASTGVVQLNGPGAGSCTIVATSSLNGVGNTPATNSSVLSIAAVTLDTSNCTPAAPRAGDSFQESFAARNSAYGAVRPYKSGGIFYAFDNPQIRQLENVQATFSYTAGAGSLINLNTTSVSNSGTPANPAVPSGAWDGWVPAPVASGMPNGPATGDTYVYNADGSVNSAPKRPAEASTVSETSGLLPVQQMFPADWQRQIAAARDSNGTTPGSAVPGSWTVTMRETGGFLNRWNHTQTQAAGSNWGYTGAKYIEAYYTVTAVYNGQVAIPLTAPTTGWQGGAITSSNPQQDSQGQTVTAANGKLTYGKMCQFTYRFTRIGTPLNTTVTQANTADATAWNGTAPAKTDANSTCALTGCSNWATYGHGSSNAAKIANSIGDSFGDIVGTFYTHDSLPRVAKDFRSSIGRQANATVNAPSSGVIEMPMGNWAFYDKHDGNTPASDNPGTGTTPPTQLDDMTTSVYRNVFP